MRVERNKERLLPNDRGKFIGELGVFILRQRFDRYFPAVMQAFTRACLALIAVSFAQIQPWPQASWC